MDFKILVRLPEEQVDQVEVERIVGCLALHKPTKGIGTQVTHLQSGVGFVRIAPQTPIAACEYHLKELSDLFEWELEPHRSDKAMILEGKRISTVIEAINKRYEGK